MIATTLHDLEQLLHKADNDYCRRLAAIDLFNYDKTALWSVRQKKIFAAVFYHVRGHFINFMWYVANFATDEQIKKIILQNIHEELGIGTKFSHEKLYEHFAQECGVDIKHELVHETHYLPFAKEFNQGHLCWLTEHDADEQFAAFASYERLDNIDYLYLNKFTGSLNLSSRAKAFFNVHVNVEHFDATLEAYR